MVEMIINALFSNLVTRGENSETHLFLISIAHYVRFYFYFLCYLYKRVMTSSLVHYLKGHLIIYLLQLTFLFRNKNQIQSICSNWWDNEMILMLIHLFGKTTSR